MKKLLLAWLKTKIKTRGRRRMEIEDQSMEIGEWITENKSNLPSTLPPPLSNCRLAFVITGLGRGGAEKMLLKLLSLLDKTKFDVRVFCLTHHLDLLPDFEAANIKVYAYQIDKPLFALQSVYRFLRDCRRFAPDLIQGWMYHGNIFAWLASKVGVAKLIFGIRACLYDFKFERWRTQLIIRLGARLSHSTDGIIYVSSVAHHHHEAIGYTSKKSLTLANGFELEKFRPNLAYRQEYREKLGLSPHNLTIGFFARFHKLKGFSQLLQAFSLVYQKDPTINLILAGQQVTDHNKDLTAEIADLGLQEAVLLVGELKEPERYLPALDLFVSPSSQEGFPNAVGEAMACGIPCVVTDVGDSALLVGETGGIVPPHNPTLLAQAILDILKNPATLRTKGDQARLRIETHFSLPAIVERYEAAYRDFYTSSTEGGG
jgi:glycosyltransferase involved in cell wall biosynthesis